MKKAIPFLALASLLVAPACDEGPVEEAAENVDDAMEDAADSIEDGLDDAKDALEEAVDDVEDIDG